MRIAFTADANKNVGEITRAIKPAVDRFGIKTTLSDRSRKPKIIIMVSKFDHALLHLLYQIRVGWLRAELVAIVSNHEDARRIADHEGIRFVHLPVTPANKPQQEAALLELVAETAPRAALHVVEGSAHQVPVAAPVEVADQIRAFMDRSTPSLVVSESSD